jgi:hypothetical protein
MMSLNLDDKVRDSSIGALSKRARRSRWKSVDDADDLLSEDGEMELNELSPVNSPTRHSVGAVPTKARRERCKSVDDAGGLLDEDGEFELKLDDSPKATPKQKKKKRSNSVGAVDTKGKRERRKSVDSDDLESSGARSKSREGRKKGDGEKRKARKGKKRSESRSSDTSSSDDDADQRRRKASADKPGKKSVGKSPKHPKNKKASRKLSSDDDPSEQEAVPRSTGGLDLNGGQVRGAGRRMGRRSSLGGPVAQKQHEEVNDILMRTQQADRRWLDASKTESSVIERRVRRRASLGADEAVMGPGPRRVAARKKSIDL